MVEDSLINSDCRNMFGVSSFYLDCALAVDLLILLNMPFLGDLVSKVFVFSLTQKLHCELHDQL